MVGTVGLRWHGSNHHWQKESYYTAPAVTCNSLLFSFLRILGLWSSFIARSASFPWDKIRFPLPFPSEMVILQQLQAEKYGHMFKQMRVLSSECKVCNDFVSSSSSNLVHLACFFRGTSWEYLFSVFPECNCLWLTTIYMWVVLEPINAIILFGKGRY